ncbi:hypothetical protein ACH4JS_23255 [Streptomyces sp. NPDC017638]|uniref:hypothetical protein n=1 Tax=Streptomyces sp. NPDC017638 TaxID=3365004 RepID=UPI003794B217
MTTHNHRGPPVRGSDKVPPRLPTRRSMHDRSGRSRLSVARDSDAYGPPVELRTLIGSSLPPGVRGALVTQAEGAPGGRLRAVWWRDDGPTRIPPGGILLSWTPADDEGRTDVTARLGLEGGQVLLASRPGCVTTGPRWCVPPWRKRGNCTPRCASPPSSSTAWPTVRRTAVAEIESLSSNLSFNLSAS